VPIGNTEKGCTTFESSVHGPGRKVLYVDATNFWDLQQEFLAKGHESFI